MAHRLRRPPVKVGSSASSTFGSVSSAHDFDALPLADRKVNALAIRLERRAVFLRLLRGASRPQLRPREDLSRPSQIPPQSPSRTGKVLEHHADAQPALPTADS